MAKKKAEFDGVVVNRSVTPDGRVHTSDKNGRSCWSNERSERVVLTEDLRKYGPGLHVGQLGRTVPGTSDGYKWVTVQFDGGPCIPIIVSALTAITTEAADEHSRELIAQHRGTRFDADDAAAEIHRESWTREQFGQHIDSDGLTQAGAGPEEVYAYTFPSLVELAALKGQPFYPVKIGCTRQQDGGSFSRVSSQLVGAEAAYPERVKLLLVFRCAAARAMEVRVHRYLRANARKAEAAVGREWFLTTAEEVLRVLFESGDGME